MELYDKMTDEELIGKLRAGRRDVADYLVEKYKGLVRQKARTMYLIGGETDDLIQEGMIGLFKAVQNYDSGKEASFQTFARLCIDRQLYKAVSGSNRQKHQPLNTYVSLSQEEGTDHLEELWEQSPETITVRYPKLLEKPRNLWTMLCRESREKCVCVWMTYRIVK